MLKVISLCMSLFVASLLLGLVGVDHYFSSAAETAAASPSNPIDFLTNLGQTSSDEKIIVILESFNSQLAVLKGHIETLRNRHNSGIADCQKSVIEGQCIISYFFLY